MGGIRTVAGVAVVGVALAGCAQGAATIAVSAGKGGGEQLFEAMAEAQQDAGSYRFEMTMAVEDMELTGSGEAVAGPTIEEQSMAMTMTLPDGMGESEVRLVDSKFYMSTGMFGLPGDDQWIVLDPAGDDPFSQMFGDMMGEMLASADVQAQLAEYSESIAVEEVGSDTIDGVEVTEYEAVIDVDAAADLMGMNAEIREQIPVQELTSTLWVDDDALARQISSDLGGLGTMEMRFFDYGADVSVQAPATDQVTDFLSFFEELTGQELSEEELAELAEMFAGNGAE